MIDASAIREIAAMARTEELTIDGREYTTKQIFAVREPVPEPVVTMTLEGIKAFIERKDANFGGNSLGAFIHVPSPTEVLLINPGKGKFCTTICFCKAQCPALDFPFNRELPVDEFITLLQAMFVRTEIVENLLRFVGNLTDGNVRTFTDDGVTQEATIKKGVSGVALAKAPNPITLSPFRTFREIEQPSSLFIFRMRAGQNMPTCLLRDVGDEWKLQAIKGIKEWFATNMPGVDVVG